MLEVKGNLWKYPADLRVITTNGTVKKNGAAVMGRGCALEAKIKYPRIDFVLGTFITVQRNHVHMIADDLASFPVKHHWRENADLVLIERSANELVKLVDTINIDIMNVKRVVMPRPGCGNGGLNWNLDVKQLIEPILDDRFHVITFV